MKRTDQESDEREFAAAWRAFQAEDAALTAPPSVHAAVMEAWREAGQQPTLLSVLRQRPRRAVIAIVAAAVAMLVATAVMHRARTLRASPPAASQAVVAPVAGATEPLPSVTIGARLRTEAIATRARPQTARDTLPATEVEPLQLVRVRMPRVALQAFGVSLVEPEAAGLVDVDLVVGDDGSPRSIRNVTAVLDLGQQE